MKVSLLWLSSLLGRDLDCEETAHRLTMAGLEVEAIEPAVPPFTSVVIGHVISREKHPDADRLSVCQVDVGEKNSIQIVCGAANVRADLKVAVIQVGGQLSPDFKIKRSKLRGVESNGMICSASELGLAEKSEGILELANDAPVGKDFRSYYHLNDEIMEIAITPNRGDCLGMLGVAREFAALDQTCWDMSPVEPVSAATQDTVDVMVAASEACPRYLGRVVSGVNMKAGLPVHIAECLRRSGLRLTGFAVVDLINYVMIELGQPMHAFDAAHLAGSIKIRKAASGESIELIDDSKVDLKPGTLVIADDKAVLAIAGVMGGAASAVTESTQSVFLESAYFDPVTVAVAAKGHGVTTDSSYRFERGVDFNLQRQAMERVSGLILEVCGGAAGPVVEQVAEKNLPVRSPIHLRSGSILRYLGESLPAEVVEKMLRGLGMQVETVKGDSPSWQVLPPSHRFDLIQEVDLVEEVIRLNGYDQIPVTPLMGVLSMSHDAGGAEQTRKMQAKNRLKERAYQEVVTYSFVAPEIELMLSAKKEPAVTVANPLSREMSVMRRSLWPGLIQALAYNLNRQHTRVRFFEHGKCFFPADKGGQISQSDRLSGLAVGPVQEKQWGEAERPVDFYDIKNDVEQLLVSMGYQVGWVKSDHPALHPHQQLSILVDGASVGLVGALHPEWVDQLDLTLQPYLFEINWSDLKSAKRLQFSAYSRFPSSKRDLALVADESVCVGDICDNIRKVAGPLLNNVVVFDIYRSSGVGEGKKSIALEMTFQDPARTLVDEEIETVIAGVVASLAKELRIQLRE